MAEVLNSAGAKVAVASRRAGTDAGDLADSGIVGLACDLSRLESLDRLVEEARDALGSIDVLINNGGVGYGLPAVEEELEMIQRVLAVNVVAPYRLAQLVYPEMAERGAGSIINVTSIAAHVGIGRIPQGAYAASKGGLLALTRELATQWGRDGIRVNAIAPSFVPSDMTEGIFGSDKLKRYVERNTPLPRFETPEDLDGAVLYLASDASSFMTGQTLVVDGGWTAR